MIKVFKFQVSNWASSPSESDKGTGRYFNARSRIMSENNIETIINNWIQENNVDVIDIKVNNVDIEYHNNGRGNFVELWYTIIYKK